MTDEEHAVFRGLARSALLKEDPEAAARIDRAVELHAKDTGERSGWFLVIVSGFGSTDLPDRFLSLSSRSQSKPGRQIYKTCEYDLDAEERWTIGKLVGEWSPLTEAVFAIDQLREEQRDQVVDPYYPITKEDGKATILAHALNPPARTTYERAVSGEHELHVKRWQSGRYDIQLSWRIDRTSVGVPVWGDWIDPVFGAFMATGRSRGSLQRIAVLGSTLLRAIGKEHPTKKDRRLLTQATRSLATVQVSVSDGTVESSYPLVTSSHIVTPAKRGRGQDKLYLLSFNREFFEAEQFYAATGQLPLKEDGGTTPYALRSVTLPAVSRRARLFLRFLEEARGARVPRFQVNTLFDRALGIGPEWLKKNGVPAALRELNAAMETAKEEGRLAAWKWTPPRGFPAWAKRGELVESGPLLLVEAKWEEEIPAAAIKPLQWSVTFTLRAKPVRPRVSAEKTATIAGRRRTVERFYGPDKTESKIAPTINRVVAWSQERDLYGTPNDDRSEQEIRRIQWSLVYRLGFEMYERLLGENEGSYLGFVGACKEARNAQKDEWNTGHFDDRTGELYSVDPGVRNPVTGEPERFYSGMYWDPVKERSYRPSTDFEAGGREYWDAKRGKWTPS